MQEKGEKSYTRIENESREGEGKSVKLGLLMKLGSLYI